MPDLAEMMKRQQVLADFGDLALRSEDLDEVLTKACRLVAEALGTDRAKVLEIKDDGGELLVRAGVGWGPDVVGQVCLPMSERSSETFSIREAKPVVTQDIRQEDRFDVPEFMKDAGVIAFVNVPIFVPGQKPYGLLQVDADKPRDFGDEDIKFLRTYATILGPIIDRLRKVRSLRASEERFRLIVETARDYAIFTTDAQDRIDGWYSGAEAVFGWTGKEAIGQSASITFTPEDRKADVDKNEVETARRDGSAQNVRWHMRKDGERVFIEGAVWALHDADGTVQGFVKVGQDVTDRRNAEAAFRDSEMRQRALIEGMPQLVWRAGEPGQWTWASPQWTAFTGQVEDESRGWDWLRPVHPDDRDIARDAWVHAVEHGGYEAEYRICAHEAGTYRWFQTRAAPVRNEAGEIVEWLGTSTDIDELRSLQDRQRVLVAELQHRTFNLLGMVKSTADASIRSSASLDEFKSMFGERIAALARVQRLLSRLEENDRVTFDELLRGELNAVGALHGDSGRVTLDGPEGVALRSGTVQTLAMALHELTTNAVKYGALKEAGAQLNVRWRVEAADQGQPWLHVEWRETGVPMPSADAKPQGTGQGRRLIEEALPYQLKAETTYVMEADGVRCSIALPISAQTRRR